jgi:NADH-quinone oxidoreductase subunit L
MTHAFFKALVIPWCRFVIHAMHHEQDIRKMGGLEKIPAHYHITFLMGCMAIAGIPSFLWFLSPKMKYWQPLMVNRNKVYWIIGVFTAGMTAFYMFRLYATTFLGKFQGYT